MGMLDKVCQNRKKYKPVVGLYEQQKRGLT
jgi:hypothetical protein